MSYFKLFFTDKIIEDIVLESNRYRNQVQLQLPSKRTCKPIVKEEISAFIGFTIAMEIAKLYWKSKGGFHMPWFAMVMTQDRFEEIYRYLHLANNDKQAPRDSPNFNRLHKLGILPCELSLRFLAMYLPEQNLSIDEQIIGTKSRISFIQYMPKKSKKFGIKVWVLFEAKTGYCLQFQIYTGKSENEGAERGLTYRVILDLLHNYLGKNFHVYFDKFYASYKLVHDLQNKSTFSCGTTN